MKKSPLALNRLIAHFVKQRKVNFRTTAFCVRTRNERGIPVMRGQIDNLRLKRELLVTIQKKSNTKVHDRTTVLPDRSVGDCPVGVVRLSASNIYRRPSRSSGITTQAMMGMTVRVLKRRREWSLVKLPDGYIGWMDETLVSMTVPEHEAWMKKPKVIFISPFALIYSRQDAGATVVGDAVSGNVFAFEGKSGSFAKLSYPDNRIGYVRKSDITPLISWARAARDTPETIAKTARSFAGVPYFWGGTSPKAMDCSGFVKMVYFLNGVLLPRDADQQAQIGKPVLPGKSWENLDTGDLLFFGKSSTRKTEIRDIVHVGISLGGDRFIHESGDVHCSSLHAGDPLYDHRLASTFCMARRIIGAGERAGVKRVRSCADWGGYERE
jgi:cell wall-associated NlpC family hydrolase